MQNGFLTEPGKPHEDLRSGWICEIETKDLCVENLELISKKNSNEDETIIVPLPLVVLLQRTTWSTARSSSACCYRESKCDAMHEGRRSLILKCFKFICSSHFDAISGKYMQSHSGRAFHGIGELHHG
ncbi:hypothetical protein AXG93_625s1230 [Marchantia polymorpha subsp. ruderalis]|uniref:Uncharacterized protein n=1 Tax=Marchantia polymorpha subsp. ruderalis TaxID=1480154 RepID=A0A176VDB9_MARPO|nr:hypothetical protein AXG93_625s1230 [Marchantia polymorpha subsp. ruderalis]